MSTDLFRFSRPVTILRRPPSVRNRCPIRPDSHADAVSAENPCEHEARGSSRESAASRDSPISRYAASRDPLGGGALRRRTGTEACLRRESQPLMDRHLVEKGRLPQVLCRRFSMPIVDGEVLHLRRSRGSQVSIFGTGRLCVVRLWRRRGACWSVRCRGSVRHGRARRPPPFGGRACPGASG